MASFRGTVLTRYQAESCAHLTRMGKPLDVIERSAKRDRDNRADARHTLQSLDNRIASGAGAQRLIDGRNLRRQRLDQSTQGRERLREGRRQRQPRQLRGGISSRARRQSKAVLTQ